MKNYDVTSVTRREPPLGPWLLSLAWQAPPTSGLERELELFLVES